MPGEEVVDTGISAVAAHPDREYTPEERAHLGLPELQE